MNLLGGRYAVKRAGVGSRWQVGGAGRGSGGGCEGGGEGHWRTVVGSPEEAVKERTGGHSGGSRRTDFVLKDVKTKDIMILLLENRSLEISRLCLS